MSSWNNEHTKALIVNFIVKQQDEVLIKHGSLVNVGYSEVPSTNTTKGPFHFHFPVVPIFIPCMVIITHIIMPMFCAHH